MKRPLLLVHVFVLLQSWPSLPAFAILISHSRCAYAVLGILDVTAFQEKLADL
ncbi:hypothetical protein D5086_008532, partial [Populus alba]